MSTDSAPVPDAPPEPSSIAVTWTDEAQKKWPNLHMEWPLGTYVTAFDFHRLAQREFAARGLRAAFGYPLNVTFWVGTGGRLSACLTCLPVRVDTAPVSP